MRFSRVVRVLGALLFLAAVPAMGIAAETAAETAGRAATPAAESLPSELCLGCHGNEGFGMPGADGKMRSLHVVPDKFKQSVHGKRLCVECHKDITEIPHKPGVQQRVSCVQCHEDLWAAAQRDGKTEQEPKLGMVVKQIDRYMRSIHARPNIKDQSRTNATCYACHDSHYVYPTGSPIRAEWRLNIPNTCGKCHVQERDVYMISVHGSEVLQNKNPNAAICSDCHTTHDVANAGLDSTKLVITRNCGNCHKEMLKTYTDTYHGQVNTLGYAYTAKCFDCHGNHGIRRVSDAESSVHPDKRLATCQKCHKDATPGFVSFQPHGNTHDIERYPYLWYASKFMILLLVGVFAFFWSHSALWFYREYKDRQARKSRPHVQLEEMPKANGRYYARWSAGWRVLHLIFALSVMTLVLTGMSVFYADSAWARVVMDALGGPRVASIIHRTAAVIFGTIFFGQLLYFMVVLGRNWKTFQWFGPNSLVPCWQDLWDVIAMFNWFFGKGPRPVLDRWSYWEKFDYWAPFWGVAIIGGSGLMLWAKSITAAFLPGWVFNVATLFHGEEAFLAAVFLFTVHFFNNHFRPDKFPLDTVMFTGRMPLEEFRREHTVEYDRLVKTGQLQKFIVDAPSEPMQLGSKILGFTLLFFGLSLLAMVLIGFIGSMKAA